MAHTYSRLFRLWDYNVSHNQLLLRSPRSPDVSKNIDIVFWGVQYIGIPTALAGIEIDEATTGDMQLAEQMLGRALDSSDVRPIVSRERRYLIVASGFKVLENELDIFESSLEYFAGSDPNRNLGAFFPHNCR